MNTKRVVVAMSGGVDSSVAAYLLKQKNYEVIGVTMCFGTSFNRAGDKHPACCGLDAIDDAKRVASKLGIKHYLLNFGEAFQEKVIDDFIKSYLKGETPNPCIRCNQFIKFGALLKKAKELDAFYLATGHYARIVFDKKINGYHLLKGIDSKYDQSYFLFPLKREDLCHFLFPLGDVTKRQVRDIANSLKLSIADKPSSQDICFSREDYRNLLKQYKREFKPGSIKLVNGKKVGEHKGIGFYTIGQRDGLGVALGKPQYVNRIDTKKNTVFIGDRNECLFRGCLISELNSFTKVKTSFVAAAVKIRYNQKEAPCKVRLLGRGRAQIVFKNPQFAVTPGQAAVVYVRDKILLGGKIIEQIK